MAEDYDEFNADPVEAAKREIAQEEAEARAFLERRAQAYKRLFTGSHPDDVRIVMDDLRAFCRADVTSFHENERIHVLITGRQEVMLRIEDHLHLSVDGLVARFNSKG